ncbi:hypothetical protein QN219_10535 [Sinorhizobium sp. 7-81]|uniref:hypothetical protein n=1 Tax=Sinorhizobium sp. 8-89 TaxID=3049089 RepID=UPI0024C42E44|nr:hypothetical protein [Sinorhizobium sp. 8-89]MDK1490496.1 hypothetical protein [Sinorhizobium sp. 8-89]
MKRNIGADRRQDVFGEKALQCWRRLGASDDHSWRAIPADAQPVAEPCHIVAKRGLDALHRQMIENRPNEIDGTLIVICHRGSSRGEIKHMCVNRRSVALVKHNVQQSLTGPGKEIFPHECTGGTPVDATRHQVGHELLKRHGFGEIAGQIRRQVVEFKNPLQRFDENRSAVPKQEKLCAVRDAELHSNPLCTLVGNMQRLHLLLI